MTEDLHLFIERLRLQELIADVVRQNAGLSESAAASFRRLCEKQRGGVPRG